MAGFNLLTLAAPSAAELRNYSGAAATLGGWLDGGYPFAYFVAVEPSAADGAAAALSPADVLALNRAYRCHGRWGGLLLGRGVGGAPGATQVPQQAALAAAAAMRTVAQGGWLMPLATAASAADALALGRAGLPLAMPSTPAVAKGMAATEWARAVAAEYAPMRDMLGAAYEPKPDTWPVQWVSKAPMGFVAALDACASESDSMLRWAAFSALAYGARGLYWRGAAACAPAGSAKFGLLASINTRIAAWGNTFTPEWPLSDYHDGGYNVTKLWSTGSFELPGATRPGVAGSSSEDDLVQGADDDVLIAELGSLGKFATPLLYVVDMRVALQPGAAPLRTLSVRLRADVTATQPLEGDCAATRCQCGLSLLGPTLSLRMPGGSGQLVALAMASPPGVDVEE